MLLDKRPALEEKFKILEGQLSDPEIMTNNRRYAKIAREHRDLSNVLEVFDRYSSLLENIEEDEAILMGDDDELKEIVKEELDGLKDDQVKLEEELKVLLIPKDPADQGAAILEIRAGTGGDEAALFASDLMRMYLRYAENNAWKHEIITLNELGSGGTKEAIIQINGEEAYGRLKFESGVHRVQRIPQTESSGRIHTSAATVAVLPEAEEVDIEINTSDLRIDTFRASGAGGQHVNKTESAIRITHLPTGLVVSCQDESSQHKNKDKAMKVLRARLLAEERDKQNSEVAALRKTLVSTGDRSAKIRTYNYPQGRVTDHRINLTLYRLEEITNGDLSELHEKLVAAEMVNRLEEI
ncbi:MAG: peptide chain release factor 1 [Candidatus Marinimicrobia bacterium]|nr:peptide chain release factor 1 [Candidatus Neomarinimicrobiota bacterium]MCF7850798.1 peptide chain release factor 1 [Candidatus Neomarinimicrobiota bacterium]MCF7904792.1 peptide chain release factor 1 [Candidatus Neomarinimicrobiota bacterium]